MRAGVGKTCLLLRYVEDEYTTTYVATIGVDFKSREIKVGERMVKIQVGTPSQACMRMLACMCTECCGCVNLNCNFRTRAHTSVPYARLHGLPSPSGPCVSSFRVPNALLCVH